MALKYGDRVWETTATTGTGTYALGGAKTGYQAFSSVCSNTDTCYYAATDGTSWEVGLGTWATGNNLARTTVISSSNSNNAVSWSAGSKDIFLDIPAYAIFNIRATTFGETPINLGSLTGTINVDLSTGTFFYGTVTGTTTITITNPPASGIVAGFTLELTNPGSQTITWTNGKWPGGAAPAFTSSGVDIIGGYTRDGGSTIRYALSEKDSK